MTTPNDPYNQGNPQQGGYQQQGGYPQGGQPQGGYPQGGQPQGYPQQGGYQPAPPLSHGEMAAPARPKSVDTAYLLWLVAAGLGILGSLIGFATAQAIADETARSLGVDPALVASAQPSYGSIIFSLIIAVLWIVVVMQMRKGANWARILLTVLGGLSVLFGLIGLAVIGILFSIGFLGAIQALLNLVQLVAIIGGIVFMFKSDSNHYFKAS